MHSHPNFPAQFLKPSRSHPQSGLLSSCDPSQLSGFCACVCLAPACPFLSPSSSVSQAQLLHRSSGQAPLPSGSLADCACSLIFSPKLFVNGLLVAFCLFKGSHSGSLRRLLPLLASDSLSLTCYRTHLLHLMLGCPPTFHPPHPRLKILAQVLKGQLMVQPPPTPAPVLGSGMPAKPNSWHFLPNLSLPYLSKGQLIFLLA